MPVSDVRTRTTSVIARGVGKIGERDLLHSTPLVLELDLTEPPVQGPATDPIAAIAQRRRGRLTDVLKGLRKAARDDRVSSLLAKVGSSKIGFARTQELRDAVLAFRAAGKPAVAWAETFGEWGPGTGPYYLATAFDEIWLQPIGDVTLTGLTLGTPFLRDAFDKLGVEPQLGQRYEYKNAADTLMRSTFSDAHREAVTRVAASVFEQVIADIAKARAVPAERLRELVDQAPLSADDALAARLVDRIGYRDEVYHEVLRRAGESAQLQYVARYVHPAVSVPARRPRTIALIWGLGPIVQGRGARGPLSGQRTGSDTVTAAFRAAARDRHVEAIVFRVDSPGGSAVASDAIWRAVTQAGKPVVVSMGDVAGSGGYYVSMAADAIVAEPSTITGSIGVIAGKLVTDGLWNRLGVTFDSVAEGSLARMFSTRSAYDEAERAALERWLDRVYETFVGKVAQSRGMTRDQVHAVARGRIWTGADAKERGLVDVLGGLDRAVELACARAGIPAGTEARLVTYPKVSPLDRVRAPRSSESPGAADATSLSGWDRFAGLAAAAGLPASGPLTVPWLPAWR